MRPLRDEELENMIGAAQIPVGVAGPLAVAPVSGRKASIICLWQRQKGHLSPLLIGDVKPLRRAAGRRSTVIGSDLPADRFLKWVICRKIGSYMIF